MQCVMQVPDSQPFDHFLFSPLRLQHEEVNWVFLFRAISNEDLWRSILGR